MTLKLSLKDRESIKKAIEDRNEFTASKLQGVHVRRSFETVKDAKGYYANLTAGALIEPSRSEFVANRSNLVYVVYSYDTPIYWVYNNEDEYLEEKFYSHTTQKHQAIVKEYWDEQED